MLKCSWLHIALFSGASMCLHLCEGCSNGGLRRQRIHRISTQKPPVSFQHVHSWAVLTVDLFRDSSLLLISPLYVLQEKSSFLSTMVLEVDSMPTKYFGKHPFPSYLPYQPMLVEDKRALNPEVTMSLRRLMATSGAFYLRV
jgi:hypothetical protein